MRREKEAEVGERGRGSEAERCREAKAVVQRAGVAEVSLLFCHYRPTIIFFCSFSSTVLSEQRADIAQKAVRRSRAAQRKDMNAECKAVQWQ